jgi:hypothetical protein
MHREDSTVALTKSLLVAVAGALLAATSLAAQDLASAHVGVARVLTATDRPLRASYQIEEALATQRPRWPFILGGAVIGAAAASFALTNALRLTDDAMIVPPQFIVGVVGVGAGIGALGGRAVSAVVQ